MASPHPGQLRHMVEIGETVNIINANGYPEETPTILCRVWAAVDDEASKYMTTAQAETARRGLAFTIRWRQDIRPGMWVLWNGTRHTITEIGEYDFRRRYMKLVTVSGKEES